MSETSLTVEIRSATGKGVARKLRAAGRVPAIFYGHGRESVSLTIDPVALEKIIKSSHAGMNTLFDLTGPESLAGRTVLVKELQRHPARGGMLHADLYEVDQDATITVSVPIQIVGSAIGVTLGGGLLDHVLREIEIECLPRAIPDELSLEVSELQIGDSLHVRDIELPQSVELRTDADLSVVSVVAPAVEEEPVVEAEEGAPLEGEAAPEGEDETEAGAAPATGAAASDDSSPSK